MLFSEVYGTYYNVLAKLLERSVDGNLTRESMDTIIREKGFEESILTIPEALESQTWPCPDRWRRHQWKPQWLCLFPRTDLR